MNVSIVWMVGNGIFISLSNSGWFNIVIFFLSWIQSLHWLITLLLRKPLQLLLNQLLSISEEKEVLETVLFVNDCIILYSVTS